MSRKENIKLWLDFIREKKVSILLYVMTVCLFLFIAGLYRMEYGANLIYGVELSAFFWMVAGFLQGRKYVAKRRALYLLLHSEGLEKQGADMEPDMLERAQEELLEVGSGELEKAYLSVIELLEEKNVRQRSSAREQQTSQNDYYVMWAHQIKTPIAAMKLLLGNREENQGRENFLLKEELFKIEQYVEMVLHFQRLQSMEADLVLEEYELYALLKQAVRKYSVLFINKGVSLQLSEMQLLILTDEKWFSFCIEQLLSNSIKYTEKGEGRISIYLSGEKPDTLVIEDNGIGIRPEDLPRIFERGFTGYNGRMDRKSTGIGLYLCKQILDRLGNEITVESRENQGTRVFLKLRRRKDIRE